MVLTLLEISSLVVRNAVVDGGISNLSDLPLALRRWMFEVFRRKRLLEHIRVIRLFEQPGFFDEFAAIRMHDQDEQCTKPDSEAIRVYDGSFVQSLVTIFDADWRLAGDLVELSVSFYSVHSSAIHQDETRRLIENVAKLLSVCRNLKQLQLVAHEKFSQKKALDTSVKLPLSPAIMDISLPALEHLSLIGCAKSVNLKWLPRRWFETIRSLELRLVYLNCTTFADVLTVCRDTLTSLKVKYVGRSIREEVVCPLPVALPKLKSFRFESHWPHPTIFEKILEHCPNLTTAILKMGCKEISKSQLAAIARLSTRLQLDLTIWGQVHNFSELLQIAGECIIGLECPRFKVGEYDKILARCRNLQRLKLKAVNSEVDNAFLVKLFSDRERAATLTHLGLTGNLSAAVLNCLFTNLFNLQYLLLGQSFPYLSIPVEISDGLRLWAENGARPSSISLCCIDIGQEELCSFLKTCGRSLRYMLMMTRDHCEELNNTELNLVANCCPFIGHFIKCESIIQKTAITHRHSKYEHVCFNYEPFYAPSDTLKKLYKNHFLWWWRKYE